MASRRLHWVMALIQGDGDIAMSKQHLLASDFDQTLSFNDSGHVLSELLGTSGFAQKVAGLSQMSLVQPGGELAYLILHDPEYRRVRQPQARRACVNPFNIRRSYYSAALISCSICSLVAMPECFLEIFPSRSTNTETGMPQSGP